MALDADALAAVMKRDDVRGLWPQPLGTELVRLFGEAFATHLGGPTAPPVVVIGYDARRGSEDLALALARGVEAAGGQAVWLGLVSTEHVYYMTGRYPERYAGGAMVTASHNPAEYNGIKFVYAGARPLATADLEALQAYVGAHLRAPTACDPRAEFAAFALARCGFAAAPAAGSTGCRAVVAAGHGVGARAFAPLAAALAPHGYEFSYLDPEPDGSFPRGVPNPLLPSYLRRLGAAVREAGADLGIGFDGDADRAGFVDDRGQEITASQVLALVAEPKLAAAREPVVIMRNLCGSRLVPDALGGRPGVTVVDTPVGHGRIKLLMRHEAFRDRVILAGEHSGHYFYPEFYAVDSGMFTSLYMLRLAAATKARGGPLRRRLRGWRRRYAWSSEINFRLRSRASQADLLRDLAQRYHGTGVVRYEVRGDPELGGLERVFANAAPYDPSRLTSPDLKLEWATADGREGWWFVVRPSGNEPQLRLNLECWGPAAARQTRARVAELTAVITTAGGQREG